jgi:uncharacterized repeat protein (TIGR03803 family)
MTYASRLLRYSLFTVNVMILGSSLHAIANEQRFNIVHTFTGIDGKHACGGLYVSDSELYGMTPECNNGGGTYFKFNTQDNTFSLLHTFTNKEGVETPAGSLTQIGTSMFGTAEAGGKNHLGSLFKMGIEGESVTILHTFNDFSEGVNPLGNLTLGGSTLYGTAVAGGAGDYGIIFKIDTDGSGFDVLHSFPCGNVGIYPDPVLILDGTTLYGTTQGGDPYGGQGVLFKINTDGSGFSVLHTVNGNGTNLLMKGSTIYAGSDGVLFEIGTDGNGYKVLHMFTGSDGQWPHGDLVLIGSTLYGTTFYGGSSNKGTVFSIDTDGSNFNVLHSFEGGINDGDGPWGGLSLVDSTLYGMTVYGGSANDGVLYSITVPEPSAVVLLGISIISLLGFACRKSWNQAICSTFEEL